VHRTVILNPFRTKVKPRTNLHIEQKKKMKEKARIKLYFAESKIKQYSTSYRIINKIHTNIEHKATQINQITSIIIYSNRDSKPR